MKNILDILYARFITVAFIFTFFTVSPVFAAEFHSPPKNYLFGNHIDTHQESKLKIDGNGNPISIKGFFISYLPAIPMMCLACQ